MALAYSIWVAVLARSRIRSSNTKPVFLIGGTSFGRGAGFCSRTFTKSSARRKPAGTQRTGCSPSRPYIPRLIAVRPRQSSAKKILQQHPPRKWWERTAASMNNGARATNVLFTCAGRRTFAVRAFQQALNNCGRVFACDASPDAPALQVADKGFVVPPADANNYLDVLLTICREQRVRLLIPAVESELPLLAAHRARFLKVGTLPLVISPEIITICIDKLETATCLDRCGLAAPRTYVQLDAAREALSRGELSFPLVVKPRWGVSSIGLAFAEDDQELDFAFKTAEKQI